jgi:hypothetical protein
MRRFTIFALIFWPLSFICLCAGNFDQIWINLAAGAAACGIAYLTRRQSPLWSPSILLVAVMLLAVTGLINGGSSILIIAAVSFALIGWDLWLELRTTSGISAEYENRYLIILVSAVGSGSLLSLIGTQLHFQLPFGWLVLLLLLIYFGLEGVFNALKRL